MVVVEAHVMTASSAVRVAPLGAYRTWRKKGALGRASLKETSACGTSSPQTPNRAPELVLFRVCFEGTAWRKTATISSYPEQSTCFDRVQLQDALERPLMCMANLCQYFLDDIFELAIAHSVSSYGSTRVIT